MTTARRILKIALLSVLGLIGAIVLLIACLMGYQAIDRTDTFALTDAQLEEPGFLRRYDGENAVMRENREFHAQSHRLAKGTGFVLAYRFYSNGSVTIIDDEHYRKATLWLSAAPTDQAAEIPFGGAGQAVLVYSDGGSAWPHAGCSGLGTGVAHIEKHGVDYKVGLKATIAPAKGLFRCEPETIDLTFQARGINFDQLTPWLGLRGQHPYSETYRFGG